MATTSQEFISPSNGTAGIRLWMDRGTMFIHRSGLEAALFGSCQDETKELILPNGRRALLRSVEREDGSGRSFNLYMWLDAKPFVVCVRIASRCEGEYEHANYQRIADSNKAALASLRK